jgi:VWFA-related protein
MKVSGRLYLLLAGLSIPLFTQQSALSYASGFSVVNESTSSTNAEAPSSNPEITLDVVVTNKSGKPQSGLQQQDFTLTDNKAPQKILTFEAVEGANANPPVEVVLVMDTVNVAPQTMSDERLQVQKYLRKNGGKLSHPTSIVIFSDSGMNNLNEPSTDGNALATALDGNDVIGLHAMHQAAGSSGDWERLNSSVSKLYSLTQFEAKKPGRKMVIYISPGWPLLDSEGNQMYSKGKEQLFTILVGVSTALRQARVTLYSVDPGGATGNGFGNLQTRDANFGRFRYEAYLKGIPTAKEVMPPNLSLQVFAIRSGGRVLTAGNDIGGQVDDCVADINAFYVLTFEGVSSEKPNDYHNLELKVDKPGLTARTSGGYYVQQEQRPQATETKK